MFWEQWEQDKEQNQGTGTPWWVTAISLAAFVLAAAGFASAVISTY